MSVHLVCAFMFLSVLPPVVGRTHARARALLQTHKAHPGRPSIPPDTSPGGRPGSRCLCVSRRWRGLRFKRVMANQSQSSTHAFTIHPSSTSTLPGVCSFPAVILDHVGEFDDELPLLVLLTALKGVFLAGGQGENERRGIDRRTFAQCILLVDDYEARRVVTC